MSINNKYYNNLFTVEYGSYPVKMKNILLQFVRSSLQFLPCKNRPCFTAEVLQRKIKIYSFYRDMS